MLEANVSCPSIFLKYWISNLVNYLVQDYVKTLAVFFTTVKLDRMISYCSFWVFWEALRIYTFQEASIADIFYVYYGVILQVCQSYCMTDNMFIYGSRPCSVYL